MKTFLAVIITFAAALAAHAENYTLTSEPVSEADQQALHTLCGNVATDEARKAFNVGPSAGVIFTSVEFTKTSGHFNKIEGLYNFRIVNGGAAVVPVNVI